MHVYNNASLLSSLQIAVDTLVISVSLCGVINVIPPPE